MAPWLRPNWSIPSGPSTEDALSQQICFLLLLIQFSIERPIQRVPAVGPSPIQIVPLNIRPPSGQPHGLQTLLPVTTARHPLQLLANAGGSLSRTLMGILDPGLHSQNIPVLRGRPHPSNRRVTFYYLDDCHPGGLSPQTPLLLGPLP